MTKKSIKWVARLISIAVLASLLLVSQVHASININVEAVQKSVAFLYAADSHGDVDKTKPIGTGFFVEIPLKSDPQRAYRVLVTARHMVDPTWAQCGQANPEVIYARVNKKTYTPGSGVSGVDFLRVDLSEQGKPTWRHHSDDHVDAAVILLTANKENVEIFDTGAVPVGLFPTEVETASESIGNPIMSAGLMPGLTGTTRNYPIFKFGQISNIPPEDIEMHCGPNLPASFVKVWLIAANLVPGNSGSPIFHVPLGGSGMNIGGTRPMLLGVQSISFLGADVAGMTPVKYVYEILQSMGLPDGDLRRGLQPPPSPTPPSAKP